MDVDDYIGFVASEGDRFATAAERGDLAAPIAGCGAWDMRDLVRHLGLIHLWAAANVAFPTDDWLDAEDIPEMARYWPELGAAWPEDGNLVDWYRRTNDNLVDVLESTPADHQCFSFLPAPTPLTMWARRQASETAIHRFDAEAARGLATHFAADFAADMLDELLAGFAPRLTTPEVSTDHERVLHVHASDVDQHWFLTFGPAGVDTSRTARDAELTLSATAAELYLYLWNRADDSPIDLDGPADLLAVWRDACCVRWTGGG